MDCNRAKTKDPGEWLETRPDFSKPIAEKLVELILNCEPDLTESIKWNILCFSGRKLVCGISACQKHVSLAFFRGTELHDPAKLFMPGSEGNTNIRSIRLTSLAGGLLEPLGRKNVQRLIDGLQAALIVGPQAVIHEFRRESPVPSTSECGRAVGCLSLL